MPVPKRARSFKSVHLRLVAAGALALFAGCIDPVRAPEPRGLLLTSNLSEIKAALISYHDGGKYEKDLEAIAASAEEYMTERAAQVTKPALVLDIDETSLSNWEQMVANDFAYFRDASCDHLPNGPCGSIAWDALARSPAIVPILKLAQAAERQHVTIFFITGRYEPEFSATESNLRNAKFPKWETLYMRPEKSRNESVATFKADTRKEIEGRGYKIIANVGDQPSDLAGGFAERTYLLANPFYRIN